MKRAVIYTALLTQLQGITAAPYNIAAPVIELNLREPDDDPRWPVIFLVPSREKNEYTRGFPNKWKIQAEIYVYTRKTNDNTGVENMLPVLDAVEAILSPQTNQRGPGSFANDLGLPGIVSHCAISGDIEIFGGYADEYTVARVPIEIVSAG